MKGDLKRRLEELTKPEQEQRFEELREELGFASPRQLNGTDPLLVIAEEFEEYIELKKILGYVD
jgi:hypothetical protein